MMNAGGTRPAVSPDGRYIAFNSAREGTWDVFVIGADGTGERRITNFAEKNFVNLGPPTWIGDRVMIWHRVNDSTRVALFDVDGHPSSPTTYPKVPDDATQIRPSPDGRRIVFLHGDRRRPRIAVSSADGSDLRDLTNGRTVTNPDWSPDGKSVVFTLLDSTGDGQLAVVSASGGDARVVTHVDPSEGLPLWASWSRDGKRIAFQTGKYNRTHIEESTAILWLADVATGNATKLTTHERPSLDETPAWIPDGSRIAFQSNRTGMLQVWTVKADGTDPRQITGQAQTVHTFLTMAGKDTFCLEQYTRNGNVISGSWVVLHPPGVYKHDYTITLGPDGIPARYTMRYTTPGAATQPDLDSVIVEYGRDTATYTFVLNNHTTRTQRVPMREAFPTLGQSWVGLELGLSRMRRLGVDSGAIVMSAPTQPELGATAWPVKFTAGDSVLITNGRILVSADGSILGMTRGGLTVRAVPSFDMPVLVKGFVDAFAPRAAALAAAAAARVEVAVPSAQLDKLVGEYSLNATTTLAVMRDGDHLMASVPSGPNGTRLTLAAQSPTQFFVRERDLGFVFDVDANGVATALTILQGEGKQRLVKVKK